MRLSPLAKTDIDQLELSLNDMKIYAPYRVNYMIGVLTVRSRSLRESEMEKVMRRSGCPWRESLVVDPLKMSIYKMVTFSLSSKKVA